MNYTNEDLSDVVAYSFVDSFFIFRILVVELLKIHNTLQALFRIFPYVHSLKTAEFRANYRKLRATLFERKGSDPK